MRFKPFLSIVLFAGACARGGPADVTPADEPAIVPRPARVQSGSGWFRVSERTAISLPVGASQEMRRAIERFTAGVRSDLGIALPISPISQSAIQLTIDAGASTNPEGYRLRVTSDRITIAAPAEAGLFYGLQTLRQLLPVTATGWASIRGVQIEDAPRFPYRGMHLDVSRHFFPLAFVKQYIDLMSQYKLNTFHWHLTEDQGWRLEIKRYPRLTEVGGCRKETMVLKNFNPYVGDGIPVCGFYTQEEAREIVQYARERFITVIPEIEMPGHAVAALAAYPELACTPGPFEVATRWGVFEDGVCPKEETFTFLENVLDEVTRIFPAPYLHIGGDEVPKVRWKGSEVAQAVMRREGLKNEEELQSYFIRRIEAVLNARGKRLIGWDEILEGGLAPNATVMSWRGLNGGIAAARQGHDVIMTPNSHLYFDHYQGPPEKEPFGIGGNSPLEKVYSFDPVPPELTETEARHILGAQANVWTEYIKTPDHVQYMVFPRLFALSEVVWTPKERRSWESFRARVPAQLRRLDQLGVRYRPLD